MRHSDNTERAGTAVLSRYAQKLRRRVSDGGVRSLPGWASQWLYWNAGGHRLDRKLGHGPRKYNIREPIIVYQMGKVGSSSVFHSLVNLQLDVPIYHLHYLNQLDENEAMLRRMFPDGTGGALHLIERGRMLRAQMAQNPNQKWNLLSLVRTPIPRLISAFFQDIEPVARRMGYANPEQLTARELAQYFVSSFSDETPSHWFQEQVQPLFGIDVYATPFARGQGYQIYQSATARLLLLRLEDLNRVAANALWEFLKIPNFKLVAYNIGEAKSYGALYREFINLLRLPPSLVGHWNTLLYARHFYTPEELQASVARWVER